MAKIDEKKENIDSKPVNENLKQPVVRSSNSTKSNNGTKTQEERLINASVCEGTGPGSKKNTK